MHIIILLLYLPLLSCTTHLPQPPPATAMNPSERQTLYDIMDTLSSDQQWKTNYPNPCTPSASWVGIECKPSVADSYLHVTRLDFGTPPNPKCKNNATFPPQIFQLPYLQSIFFFQCFTKAKTTISTSKTILTSSLQQLSLKANPSLVGPIPPQIFSHLTSLQILTISETKISGGIPPEISELRSLVHLDLSYNNFTGSIPVQLLKLKNLVGLDLSYNSLSGQVPRTVGQLSMLQKLDLSTNMLTETVPPEIGKLSSLVFIALSNNKFHGKPPPELSNLKELEYLIMENNPMCTELPAEFGQLPKLQELRLANSNYTGEIPASFSLLSNLTTLSLQNNRLTGPIPIGISNLSHIYHLNLSKNLLSGEIPFDTSFLKRLGKNLDLSGNDELCLDPMQAYDSVRLGVVVCNGSNARVGGTSMKPLKTSKGRVVGVSRTWTALFIVFLVLGVFEFKH